MWSESESSFGQHAPGNLTCHAWCWLYYGTKVRNWWWLVVRENLCICFFDYFLLYCHLFYSHLFYLVSFHLLNVFWIINCYSVLYHSYLFLESQESEMKIYVHVNVLFWKLYDKMDQRNIVAMDLKSSLYPSVTKELLAVCNSFWLIIKTKDTYVSTCLAVTPPYYCVISTS